MSADSHDEHDAHHHVEEPYFGEPVPPVAWPIVIPIAVIAITLVLAVLSALNVYSGEFG